MKHWLIRHRILEYVPVYPDPELNQLEQVKLHCEQNNIPLDTVLVIETASRTLYKPLTKVQLINKRYV